MDDYIVESLRHTRRVLTPAVKVEENPILRPDRPWEGNVLAPKNVIFDKRERIFKLWYQSLTSKARRQENGKVEFYPAPGSPAEQETHHVCLAVSN